MAQQWPTYLLIFETFAIFAMLGLVLASLGRRGALASRQMDMSSFRGTCRQIHLPRTEIASRVAANRARFCRSQHGWIPLI